MRRLGKQLKAALQKVEKDEFYPLETAIKLAQETSYSKFDGSIEMNFKLNLDTKKADQQLRGSVELPKGSGKKIVVLVASDKETVRTAAKEEGADIVVDRIELEEYLKQDKYEFDLIVVEPIMMTVLGKYGKKLGPKGLMPNPKTGTVTTQIPQAVSSIKRGRATFKADRNGCVHAMIGKCSMKTEDLIENANAVLSYIKRSKPAGVKGVYLQRLFVSPTMGPGIRVRIDY